MAAERCIRTIERDDGKARLFIIARDDGRYRFEGKTLVDDEDGHGPNWLPCDISGLYASAEDAERAARREVPWLGDQTSS